MKNRTIVLSAAAIAVANLSIASFIPFARAEDPAQQQQQQPGQTGAAAAAADQSSAGIGTRAAAGTLSDVAQSDRDQIDKTLAQTVKSAVQTGKFNDLVNSLCKQDRERLQAQKPDTTQLDQTAKALDDSWKTKYGQDFDITDEKQPFATFMIMNGPAMDIGSSAAAYNQTGANTPAASPAPTDAAQQASAQEGQKAHAMIPASHGLPEVSITLVKEGGDWKLNIPNNVDANQLSQNLNSQLSQCQSMQAKWPADQSRAQAALTHHVILALQGKSAQAPGANTGTGAGSPDNTNASPGAENK